MLADIHGEIEIVKRELAKIKKNLQSTGKHEEYYLIILGDAGVNFYFDERDRSKKQELENCIAVFNDETGCQMKILFVRGNHEIRPENIYSYFRRNMLGSEVWIEDEFPNLIFLKDGNIYTVENKLFLVVGGGYSVDYFQRLLNGWGYWQDEELTDKEFEKIIEMLKTRKTKKMIILSHMAPAEYSPAIYENHVIPRTEYRLQEIWNRYMERIESWWCGHYHIECCKRIKAQEDIIPIHFCYKKLIGFEQVLQAEI